MSIGAANPAAWAIAEEQLRRSLFASPIAPTHIHVALTRVQVHQVFPRLADRYPLELTVEGPEGPRTIDLRERREVWPLPLKRKGGK